VQKLSTVAIETPGGAGITATFFKKNFKDTKILFYTITSKCFAEDFRELGIEIEFQEIDYKDVIVKERYIDVLSKYHLLRVDNDNVVGKHSLSIANISRVIEENDISCVIMMDYQKGLFDNEIFVIDLISLLKEKDIPIYVDTRTKDLSRFSGADIIKLNDTEYDIASKQYNVSTPQMLANMLNVSDVIVTKGEEGATLYSRNGFTVDAKPIYEKTSAAPDVTGCGDAFDSSFCYYYFIEKKCVSTSLRQAVNKATEFAYQPIEERLCLP
jgi:bifunctional ADP-heptose synthase (sugar kinase/adenylyltransferase)